ncbi:MAG: chemotaxis protein CheW [Saccharospirillaceae bacterium]|nr:chemotaxis protein CheW [Pseudomonadales bacterium]NRB78633.1 chemotaxis protein CheW [Saccharospirillaceae bacterium]
MNKSSSSYNSAVNSTKVSTNLVMFEYIDQLLHSPENDSLIINTSDSFNCDESISNQEKGYHLPNDFIQIQKKDEIIKINNESVSNKPIFKEPIIQSNIQTDLLNIEQDLTVTSPDNIQIKSTQTKKDKSQFEKKDNIIDSDLLIELKESQYKISIQKENELTTNELDLKDELLNESQQTKSQLFDFKQMANFDCVMVKIDTLLIALPMNVLGTINKITEPITKLPGKPKWFIGVHILDDKRRFNLIDTQDVLFTEKQKKKLQNKEGVRQFSINVYGSKWALACDEVVGSMKIEKSDVQWRNNTNSQLVLGTIKSKMCMLINVSKLIEKVTKQNILNDL